MKFLPSIILFALALAPQAAAQKAQAETQAGKRVEKEQQVEKKSDPKPAAGTEDFALERRADAEPKVVVSLCLASGDVLVRGWDRGEVRARAEDSGTLRLLTPNVRPAPRIEVLISEERDAELGSGECGSTSTIELMVPRGATVILQTSNGHVEVSDVAEARIKALSGDVNVRRVSLGVEISCLSGDVSVTDSSGPMRVDTISGVVEARNLRAASPGDNFEAKSTSGDVTLEGVSHAQVSGATVSGNVLYTGALARGGSYDFRTNSGDVTLELPAASSFSLHAKVVMSGDLDTDFPVKTTSVGTPRNVPRVNPPEPPDRRRPGANRPPNPPREPGQTRLDGTVGTGDAVVNISSFSGSLYLKKR
ncbi:MAG: putative adhesin [Acidobacteriota bacterium]|jgi:hypothetical protein|nr:putative adhesin [Acidobacteriota bacterium]